MKEFLPAYSRKIKCSGKHDIEIKQGERWDQEIRFVYFAEMDRLCPASSHQQGPGQDHSKQQYQCQRTEIPWHGSLRSKSLPDIAAEAPQGAFSHLNQRQVRSQTAI